MWCDALAHAHEAGIVHRDIKPDNVFMVGKSALVTDFGVSKALAPSDPSTPVTGVGITLGTPGYMSPEQASGDRSLDHRADVYAVGVLAYELLAGRRPFEGTSFQQLLVAQAVETPVPLGEIRPDIPPPLAAIVMRCLEKHPADRFPGAGELLAALEAVGSGSHSFAALPAGRPPRAGFRWAVAGALGIAVLALAGLGLRRRAEPALGAGHAATVALLPPDYYQHDSTGSALLADLVDRISNNLGQVSGLTVVNYMSAGALFRRGAAPTLRQVGEQLGVEHLVVFQPRLVNRGLRVSVQFIEAESMAQLWAAPYSPDSANFDHVVSDVVARVTHSLLGPGANVPDLPTSARARREGAHSAFLAGKQALRRRTPEGIAEAIRFFELAVRNDSTHAEALGRLATALGLQLAYGYQTTIPAYATAARALGLAERAVRLAPDQGEPIGFLAYIEYLTFGPIDKVREDFERAIRMRAAEADVAGWHALMLLREGKTEESLTQAQRALDLDPMSSPRHLNLALPALAVGRLALAAIEAHRAGELEPELRRPRQIEGLALLLQNRPADCVTIDLYPYLGVKAVCLAALGRTREARALVDSLHRIVESETGDAVYRRGHRRAGAGDLVRLERRGRADPPVCAAGVFGFSSRHRPPGSPLRGLREGGAGPPVPGGGPAASGGSVAQSAGTAATDRNIPGRHSAGAPWLRRRRRRNPAAAALWRRSRADLTGKQVGAGVPPAEVMRVMEGIESAGGAVIGPYREPLGGHWQVIAALPLEAIEPTPYQRDLSEPHVARLADAMEKLGRYMDPIVVVPADGKYWTPNGHHRLAALRSMGARAVLAVVAPDPAVAHRILVLNTEKAHNVRERALEVIRLAEALAQLDDRPEREYATEFEEPSS